MYFHKGYWAPQTPPCAELWWLWAEVIISPAGPSHGRRPCLRLQVRLTLVFLKGARADHVRDGLRCCCSSIFLPQWFYCCNRECREAVSLCASHSFSPRASSAVFFPLAVVHHLFIPSPVTYRVFLLLAQLLGHNLSSLVV